MKIVISSCSRYLVPGFLLLSLVLIQFTGISQVVNQATKKKISIAVGINTDLWQKLPPTIKSRTINQGFNVFATYNVPFGKSPVGFSIGLGISTHNLYGNYYVDYLKDSTAFVRIPDTVAYKRSKVCVTYLELPIEFRFRTNIGLHFGLGFKAGYLLGSSLKYVGQGKISTSYYTTYTDEKIRMKFWKVRNLETICYGPTLRIGYKWFNLNAYYQLSTMFSKGKGPETYPVTVGILLMPF